MPTFDKYWASIVAKNKNLDDPKARCEMPVSTLREVMAKAFNQGVANAEGMARLRAATNDAGATIDQLEKLFKELGGKQ